MAGVMACLFGHSEVVLLQHRRCFGRYRAFSPWLRNGLGLVFLVVFERDNGGLLLRLLLFKLLVGAEVGRSNEVVLFLGHVATEGFSDLSVVAEFHIEGFLLASRLSS